MRLQAEIDDERRNLSIGVSMPPLRRSVDDPAKQDQLPAKIRDVLQARIDELQSGLGSC